MVSTEYPPMKGGIGRYTFNLVKALRNLGLDVHVVCNEAGKGDFSGLSPTNKQNSEVLLKIIEEINPDIVHIQFEPGMYGSKLDPINRANSRTFDKINKQKLDLSHSGVVFSNYMSNCIRGCRIIYHGAEPYSQTISGRKEARSILSLPPDSKLALALGFRTVSKGWDLLKKIDIPHGWKVVVNSSAGHYSTEKYDMNFINTSNNIINLQKDFLEEKDSSLLLYASDVILLPYRITSNSGVMFDALSHGIPFIASDLAFFKEFAEQGLGITVKRNRTAFSDGIREIDRNYSYYSQNVDKFKEKLKWNFVASEHRSVYSSIKIPRS